MNCPRCGCEMTLDSHRKIPLNMCYNCGYIEGRTIEDGQAGFLNFDRLRGMNPNEAAAFISAGLKSKGLDVDESLIADWLLEQMI